MSTKKTEPRVRDRLLLELPKGSRDLWYEARLFAMRQKSTIGALVMEALREKLEREGALDKPKKK